MVTRKRRNLAVLLAVIILIIAIVLSSFIYLNSQKPYSGSVETITFGLYPNEVGSLVYIANSQQYFRNNGLNVIIKTYSSGSVAVTSMLSGQSDLALGSDFVFTNNIMKNASISAVGSICNYLNQYVIARTDKGINNIQDLKGKTIGVALGTAQQFELGQFLQLNGINLNQVTFQNIPAAATPSFLANGTVDAVITFQPYLNQIQSLLGNQTVMWSAQGNQPGYELVLSTTSWVSAHQDLVKRFLTAMVESANFNSNNQKQAIADVASSLNNTVAYETSVWPQYQYSVTLDQSLVLLLQQEARWLISNNLTTASTLPNFTNYIYTQGLEAVSPENVNIVGSGD